MTEEQTEAYEVQQRDRQREADAARRANRRRPVQEVAPIDGEPQNEEDGGNSTESEVVEVVDNLDEFIANQIAAKAAAKAAAAKGQAVPPQTVLPPANMDVRLQQAPAAQHAMKPREWHALKSFGLITKKRCGLGAEVRQVALAHQSVNGGRQRPEHTFP